MSNDLYCEPCRRLLAGDIPIIEVDENSVEFDHHVEFNSFENAIGLPCSICSLAWHGASNSPSAHNWVKIRGNYYIDKENQERRLDFSSGHNYRSSYHSNTLALIPWASECPFE